MKGHRNFVSVAGLSHLAQCRPVLVLDVSQAGGGDFFYENAITAGYTGRWYLVPQRQAEMPLLDELTVEQVATLLAEAVHSARDDAADNRDTHEKILREIGKVLGRLTMARIDDALRVLLETPARVRHGRPHALNDAEIDDIAGLYGKEYRLQVIGALATLQANVSQLRDIGSAPAGPASGDLTYV